MTWRSAQDRIFQFIVGFVFENEGGGRNYSTGAASAIGGDANNARQQVKFPFPKYRTEEAFEQVYTVVQASMDTFFNFIQ
jgi:hypothetical protein